MNPQRLKYLLLQYFNDTINPADRRELLNHLKNVNPEKVADLLDEESLSLNQAPRLAATQQDDILKRIKSDERFTPAPHQQVAKVTKFKRFYWLGIAASILLLIIPFYILRKRNIPQTKSSPIQLAKNNSKKVLLKLADGSIISLNQAQKGTLIKVGKTVLTKSAGNELVYQPTSSVGGSINTPLAYNTLSTPVGTEYQVLLPDGTHVWLNSSSSLSYPVEFAGNARKVTLSGEAYFEVAKDARKPFYVNTTKAQVRVLGTHFNIAAYDDDRQQTTTLLEGSVQISKNSKTDILKPGEQAVIQNDADAIIISKANIAEAMAWKAGYFIFNDDDLATIMKKISRWYDVDVVFKGNFNHQRFGGTFNKAKNITELLHHLEVIGNVHFQTTGRRIMVTN